MRKIVAVLMALAIYGFSIPAGYAESASDMLDPMLSSEASVPDAVASVSETSVPEAVTPEKSGSLKDTESARVNADSKAKTKEKMTKEKSKEKRKGKAKGKSKESSVSKKTTGKKGGPAKVPSKTSKAGKTKKRTLPQ